MAGINWNDLKYLLALERHKNMSQAARFLKENATTVSRHLKRLSECTGETLILLQPGGTWRLTENGKRYLEAASNFEEILQSVDGLACTRESNIKLDTTDIIAQDILVPALKVLPKNVKNLSIACPDRPASLAYGEADISVRFTCPTDGRLLVSKVGNMDIGCFKRKDRLHEKSWIGLTAEHDHTQEMKKAFQVFGQPPTLRLASLGAIRNASLKTGLGCIAPVSKNESDLIDIASNSHSRSDIWCLTHESRQHDLAIRAVKEWIKLAF